MDQWEEEASIRYLQEAIEEEATLKRVSDPGERAGAAGAAAAATAAAAEAAAAATAATAAAAAAEHLLVLAARR